MCTTDLVCLVDKAFEDSTQNLAVVARLWFDLYVGDGLLTIYLEVVTFMRYIGEPRICLHLPLPLYIGLVPPAC